MKKYPLIAYLCFLRSNLIKNIKSRTPVTSILTRCNKYTFKDLVKVLSAHVLHMLRVSHYWRFSLGIPYACLNPCQEQQILQNQAKVRQKTLIKVNHLTNQHITKDNRGQQQRFYNGRNYNGSKFRDNCSLEKHYFTQIISSLC